MWRSSMTFKHKMMLVHSNESLVMQHHFITTRKRILGQGNIFIGVCQEFCSQEASGPGGGVWSGGCLIRGACSGGLPGGDPPTVTAASGTHPTGMHSCLVMCFNFKLLLFFIVRTESDNDEMPLRFIVYSFYLNFDVNRKLLLIFLISTNNSFIAKISSLHTLTYLILFGYHF